VALFVVWPAILHLPSSPGRYNCRWQFASGIANGSGQTTERVAMKLQTCARGLLAAVAMGVVALASGTGIAHAQPELPEPPVPGIIDQILTSTPDLFVDPRDEGGPGSDSDHVGMYCENLFVRCH
jgi:hypothetical protein